MNTETPRVFIAATRQNDGKTTASLGLLAAMQKLYPRIVDVLGEMTLVAEKEKQPVPPVDQLGEDDGAAESGGIVVGMPGRLEGRISQLIGEGAVARGFGLGDGPEMGLLHKEPGPVPALVPKLPGQIAVVGVGFGWASPGCLYRLEFALRLPVFLRSKARRPT